MEVIGGWLREILLPGLGTLLVAAVLTLVRRYINRLDDERLRALLLELVRAAEQIYGPGRGAAKRRWVTEKLREMGVGPVQRDRLEAAVYELQ
ncbi:MAG: hypothetical protein ACP5KN_11700, partial [Armatimonadota bacterium]